MKNAQAGNSGGGADHSGQADKAIVPDWSPCRDAAECVVHRCRAILNDVGNLEAFECLAHGVFLRFDDAAQA